MHTPEQASRFHTRPIQVLARAIGWLSLLVATLGFITGITNVYDDADASGHHRIAAILGLFDAPVASNLFHLAVGVIGLAMSRTINRATTFLIAGALVHLIVFGCGRIGANDGGADIAPGDWLNLGLTVVVMALGVGLGHAGGAPTWPSRTGRTWVRSRRRRKG